MTAQLNMAITQPKPADAPEGFDITALKQGAEVNAEPVKLNFPVMLRKMWSGSEVQAWIDEQQPLYSKPQEYMIEIEALRAQVADLKHKYSMLRDTHMFEAIELGINAGIKQARDEAAGVASIQSADETLIYEHLMVHIERQFLHSQQVQQSEHRNLG